MTWEALRAGGVSSGTPGGRRAAELQGELWTFVIEILQEMRAAAEEIAVTLQAGLYSAGLYRKQAAREPFPPKSLAAETTRTGRALCASLTGSKALRRACRITLPFWLRPFSKAFISRQRP